MNDCMETRFGVIPSQISLEGELIDLVEVSAYSRRDKRSIVERFEKRFNKRLKILENLSGRFVLGHDVQEYGQSVRVQGAVLSYLKSVV